VARGKAVATRADKSIQGDILTADFAKDSDGKMAISKAHADKNVVLTTPREVVYGNHADYDVESGMVVITGDVKLVREQNTLAGQYATMNLNTGISKLYPVAPGGTASGSQRVKGVFAPQDKGQDKGKGQ
jgi:lipopolysaccharide export system protein LptA